MTEEPKFDFYESLMIYFGGMNKAARAIGVTYQCIVNWRKRGVPLKRIKQIEEMTKNEVHRGLIKRDNNG